MPVRLARLDRFLAGWAAYFALAETPSVSVELDEWLRRRLWQVRWKEWKATGGSPAPTSSPSVCTGYARRSPHPACTRRARSPYPTGPANRSGPTSAWYR